MEELLNEGDQGCEEGLIAEEFEEVAEEGDKCHGGDGGGRGQGAEPLLSELGIAKPYAAPGLPCNLKGYERRDPR